MKQTPATKPTRSTSKATPSPTPAKAAKPAAKATKATETSPAPKPAAKRATKSIAIVADALAEIIPIPAPKSTRKRAPKVEVNVIGETPAEHVHKPAAEAKSPKISDAQRKELSERRLAAVDAVERFEEYVIELIKLDVSPTVIGKCIDLGNSSIRRIAMRREPGLVK